MLAEIINQYHSPLYIYSESTIIANINRLKQSISYSRIMFCYAMKANSNISILKTIRDQQIGIDCVSQGEILTALKAGFETPNIRFTPTFASQS
ncbi:MAG: diaminopimelate decarboxylase, partial [Saprospiraceae bacterium]